MCIPYEKTLAGGIDNKLAKSMGFGSAIDPAGKYVTKKGQFAPEKKPVEDPNVGKGAAKDVPHYVSNGLVVK